MKLTKDWFEQKEACPNSFNWVCKQFSDEIVELDATEIINRLITQKKEIAECYKISTHPENSLDWANWVICEVFTKEQQIKYAIFAAEQVIDVYEEQCPNDSRPRNAIKTAKRYLKDQSNDVACDVAYAASEAITAANAAKATYNVIYAANTAKIAYYTAVYDAVYAAAYAAAHAASATYSANANAVTYAVNAAANASNNAIKMRKRILKYGLKLLQA